MLELTRSSLSFGDAVKSLVHGRCGCRGFRFRGRQDLEQSLVAEVWRSRKRTLVLHDNFQNVRQVVRSVSIVEVKASAMIVGSRHPVLTSQKPMAWSNGRPELPVVQSVARRESVFNVNQASLSATHQVRPGQNSCRLKDSLEILVRVRVHKARFRGRNPPRSGPFCAVPTVRRSRLHPRSQQIKLYPLPSSRIAWHRP
jgi:hypothetical protein